MNTYLAMFNLNDTMRYYLCPGKTDMRKGMYALCGVVQNQMKHSLRLGDVFIFISGDRTMVKLLTAENGGMVMYIKRLDTGRFRLPHYDEQTCSFQMEWRDLVQLVEVITEAPDKRLKQLRSIRANL